MSCGVANRRTIGMLVVGGGVGMVRGGGGLACKSICGFQSESYKTTVSAVARLMPRPPKARGEVQPSQISLVQNKRSTSK